MSLAGHIKNSRFACLIRGHDEEAEALRRNAKAAREARERTEERVIEESQGVLSSMIRELMNSPEDAEEVDAALRELDAISKNKAGR